MHTFIYNIYILIYTDILLYNDLIKIFLIRYP